MLVLVARHVSQNIDDNPPSKLSTASKSKARKHRNSIQRPENVHLVNTGEMGFWENKSYSSSRGFWKSFSCWRLTGSRIGVVLITKWFKTLAESTVMRA